MPRAPTFKAVLISALLLGGGVTAAGFEVRAGDETVDLNSIVRSLAPLKYLPQHSGSKRRALNLNITFKVGSAALTAPAKRQLDIVARALHGKELREQRFQVVGHTDASGGAAQNLALSKRRAASVRAYLIKPGDVSSRRLIASGRGEERLKNPLLPKSAENRRVEFILVERPNAVQKSTGKEKVIKW